ncbi:MAG TPA: universal stress protein [Anaerolineae bacterium]
MFKQILVPLDGSRLAESALPVAFHLLPPAAGEVILLRSTLAMHLITPAMATEAIQPQAPQLLAQFRRGATVYLTAIKQLWARPSLTIYTKVVSGDEASAIVDTAYEEAVDLIVMTSHGASGDTRWPLGSVTRKVLHAAPCPVLVLRAGNPVSHILITLDGSELAEQALAPAMEVAQRLGATVTLLHVIEPDSGHGAAETVGQQAPEGAKGGAEEYLASLADRYRQLEHSVQTAVVSGPAAQGILDFASAQHIDLIAMASGVLAAHGRTGPRRWLYGSVTEKVIHNSTASLLIVRPPSNVLIADALVADNLVAHATTNENPSPVAMQPKVARRSPVDS